MTRWFVLRRPCDLVEKITIAATSTTYEDIAANVVHDKIAHIIYLGSPAIW
jgi:hypothetical protein